MIKVISELEKIGLKLTDEQKESIKKSMGEELYSKQELDKKVGKVETDCPYLAPAPHRGKRNSSAYLPLVIEEIARLKEITAEEVENVTYENAQRLYGLIH